jgi:hypothetical protein
MNTHSSPFTPSPKPVPNVRINQEQVAELQSLARVLNGKM